MWVPGLLLRVKAPAQELTSRLGSKRIDIPLKANSWTNTSKKFINCSPNSNQNLLDLRKLNLRVLTGLLSGHYSLKY